MTSARPLRVLWNEQSQREHRSSDGSHGLVDQISGRWSGKVHMGLGWRGVCVSWWPSGGSRASHADSMVCARAYSGVSYCDSAARVAAVLSDESY